MKKRIASLVFIFFFGLLQIARADEGMWLLYLLGDKVYNNMVKKGLKLSKAQLYSLNSPSVKDAIVIFGTGCTGEIVSGQGLIFTNHHCGYDAIASASTIEHNYLQNGFWAKTRNEEIPAKGLTVQFLIRIDDVTGQVEEALKGLTGEERVTKLKEVSAAIALKTAEGNHYEGRVMSFFKGNQFLLFVYERYKDIRLVGAPAESIGKFGGDTDNWEWPRHTGDFSVFRVYGNKEGKPVEFGPENIPLKPKYFMPVSVKGYRDGDYAMIFGYHGSTNRYETSLGVKLKTDVENPSIVNLRDVRLKLMFEEMKKDPAVRLQLASEYASVANYWKFYDGESKQLLKYDIYKQKKEAEEKFMRWASGKTEFNNLFADYENAYQAWRPYAKHRIYMNEGIEGSRLVKFAAGLQALEKVISDRATAPEDKSVALQQAATKRRDFLANENKVSDQNILAATCRMFYNDIDASQHPTSFYANLSKKYGDLGSQVTYDKLAANIFGNTIILDENKWNAFVAKPDSLTLKNDPAFMYAVAFSRNFANQFASKYTGFTMLNNELGQLYLKGIMEMNEGMDFYPDANFTMRLSYGSVKSYKPRDAVFYDYECTLSGVIEKYKPGDYEFDLPLNLIAAYQKKDFGQYKDVNRNDVVVSFITTNDITGGNSGSPVLNGKGELIGLAFDGNYEALSHKLAFDKDLNRTICVDVRYILWCIDKLGGAQQLIAELSLK